ncbi:MAG TPA: glycosyltransferase family 4 protein [bacterium]|nr:glycosyltransferase family 4 protein [bacterium]
MPIIYVHEAALPERKARSIQVLNTCVSLAKLGIAVHLLVDRLTLETPADVADFYGLVLPANMTITGKAESGSRHAVRALLKQSSPQKPLLYARNLRTARKLLPLSRSTKTPLVYEAHKMTFMVVSDEARLAGLSPRRVRHKAMRTFKAESEVLDMAAGLVCTSDAAAALSRTLFGRDHKVIVARNGGPEPVVPAGANKETAASGSDGGLLRVVYVGSMGGWKGTETLLESLRYLEGCQLVVVGARASNLFDSARSLPADRLSFTGYLAPRDVMPFLHSNDFTAAVIPLPAGHSSEPAFFTCPLKLFQYMAAGIPVVASDVPSLREILRHRQNAYLVRPDDAESLADGIKTVAFDTQLALDLMTNGLETARRHTFLKRAEKLASFLKELVPGI